MAKCSTIISSLFSIVLLFACDNPPDNADSPTRPDGGIYSNPPPNPIISTSETPPGTVDMTPPTAEDADATQQIKLLTRGMNVGNFLDATPNETSWTSNTLHGWYFEAIKQAGFDNVRIPVRWNIRASDTAPDYTIDPAFFTRVDWAIAHTLSRGMAAVLDIHHYDEYFANPAGQHDKFLALWKQIAEHYKNYPKQLILEILNEPQGSVTAAIWNADMTEALAEIRATNPYRTIMIGGVHYNTSSELYNNNVAFPAGDKNIIATFHYYNPSCFALLQSWDCQGHGWDAPYPPTGPVDLSNVKWPVLYPANAQGDAALSEMAANNEAAVDAEFARVSAWSTTTGIPVYVGEFGADATRDIESRAAYIRYVARESEKYGFGWANWSFIYTFDAWHGVEGWYPQIVDALTGYTATN